MFCPRCESEYREGIARCAECDVDLVDRLEEPEQQDPVDVEMVVLLRSNNQPLLAAVQAALTAERIPHFLRGAEAASLMPLNATLVVPAEYLDAAQELVREAEQDHGTTESEVE